MFGEEEVVKSHKARAEIVFTIISFCFGIILVRLWYLQIFEGDMLYQYSLNNRLRKEVIPAPRGMIFSRNNQLLVHNIPRFDAVIIPQYLDNKKSTIEKLAKILDMDASEISDILAKFRTQAKYRPVRIKKNLSQKEVAIIETENEKMPGVQVETFISREYRDIEIGSHLLGYISEISPSQLPKYIKRDNFDYKLGDFIGQAGIEEQFDLSLRGEDGYQFMEVDAKGRMKRVISSNNLFAGIENKPATPGNNIRLTVDRDLQIAAFKALEGKVGSVVAIDVNSGEVLSMVSRPSFDPTQFSRGLTPEYWNSLVNNENRPLRDRTIQEHYPPGSTYKTFTAITALEQNLIKPDEELMCGPTFKLGKRTFHDWKKDGHGKTNVYKSLRSSVDVYFYKLASQFDIDNLAEISKSFGLGAKTEISLPRETSGWIPTKEWKKKRFGVEWQLGENLIHAIGQGFNLVTPLQLAVSYATIANNGILYRPQIIKEVFTNTGEVIKSFSPEVVGKVKIKDETFKAIKQGLYEVVNDQKGTAWWYRGRGIQMAGKTGTAQVISMSSKELFSKCEEMPYKNRHHGLFVAFAPYQNPKIAVAAVIEHGCHGSSAAAPVVRDVVTEYMKKYYPEEMEEYAKMEKAKAIEQQKKIKEIQEKIPDEGEGQTPAPSESEDSTPASDEE